MGKVTAEQKHAENIEGGNRIHPEPSENHVVDIVDFRTVRRTDRGFQIIVLREDGADSEMKQVEYDEGKHEGTRKAHSKG